MKNESSDNDLENRVTVKLETMNGGALSGITNNYGSFIPPKQNDPDAIECPRKTCRRLIYQDNSECAYCKFDLKGYFSQIAEEEAFKLEQEKLEQIEIRNFKRDISKMIFLGLLIFIAFISGLINSYFNHNLLWLNLLPFGAIASVFFIIVNWDKF